MFVFISTFSIFFFFFFFFNDTATTEIYTLSLHDALPISGGVHDDRRARHRRARRVDGGRAQRRDRKSTRLNSSHLVISYAVFCLKKKKQERNHAHPTERQYVSNTRMASTYAICDIERSTR